MHQSIAEHVRIQRCLDPVDAVTAAVTSQEVDMRGYNNFSFVLSVGNITGTIDMKVQQGNTTASYSDTTGATITQITAGQDNKIAVLDVKRETIDTSPGSAASTKARYLRVIVTPTGGSANVVSVNAISYNPEDFTPVTQHASTLELKKV